MARIDDFNYGCYCTFGLDLEKMGQGAPQDDIDSTCKQYKECLKCVRDYHGPFCNTASMDYTFKTV